MHVLQFSFYASGVVYALFYEPCLFYIYALWIVLYQLIATFWYPGNDCSIRKKLQLCIWSEPSEGNIYASFETDCTNVMKYLATKNAKDNKVTITHICVKMLAQGLASARNSLNGKIAFGKFIPFDTVDVSCLVDVEDGKDLAAVLIENVDKLNFEEISHLVHLRSTRVKKNLDPDQKKRNGPIALVPPFIVSIILEIVSFISYGLGISVPQFALKKNGFGAATITSIGGMGFKNVFAPFSPGMRSAIICAVCQVVDKPIVKNGQIVIAPMINLNFTIDHRFLDGSKAKYVLQAMEEVMQNPEKYCAKV